MSMQFLSVDLCKFLCSQYKSFNFFFLLSILLLYFQVLLLKTWLGINRPKQRRMKMKKTLFVTIRMLLLSKIIARNRYIFLLQEPVNINWDWLFSSVLSLMYFWFALNLWDWKVVIALWYMKIHHKNITFSIIWWHSSNFFHDL